MRLKLDSNLSFVVVDIGNHSFLVGESDAFDRVSLSLSTASTDKFRVLESRLGHLYRTLHQITSLVSWRFEVVRMLELDSA